MNKNSKITVGLLCLLISTFGSAAWKIAQTVASSEAQGAQLNKLEAAFIKLNENMTRMTGDIGYIRGYYERHERKK